MFVSHGLTIIGMIAIIAAICCSAAIASPAMGFHPLNSAPTVEEVQGQGTVREFIADGTPVLRVPGMRLTEGPLHTLHGVRIGQTTIPISEDRLFPSNELGKRAIMKIPVASLLVRVEVDQGTPVLLRSETTNDGIWQKGETVRVRAEWDDAPVDAQSTLLHPLEVGINIISDEEIERRVAARLAELGVIDPTQPMDDAKPNGRRRTGQE